MTKKFWNEEIETMPKAKLKEMQTERLKTLVEKIYSSNKFYRDLYDQAGVKPSDIKHLEDIKKLPFLEKRTVREAYPYGMRLATEPGAVVELHATSGTTGKSVPVFVTKNDIQQWGDRNARGLWMVGFRPGDVMQNGYGYGLPTGGFGFHYGCQQMGVMAIPIGPGQTEKQLDFLIDFGVTGMCMTPSYALYLAQKGQERGIDFKKDSKLKIGLFGAEPWPWATRMKLEELYGITAYDEFGMTEFFGPGMTCECEVRDGMHAWADDYIVECIDPLTGEWVDEGKDGELVWTFLTAEGVAMVRYRSRDLSRVWWEEKCSCGRTHPKISAIKGRTDDAVSISGFIVFPSQVEDALIKFPEMGANFRMIVEAVNNLDRCTLKVEVKDKGILADPAKSTALGRQIAEAVKDIAGITPGVQLVEPDSLPRATAGEAKTASNRVEDRRK